MVYVKEKNDVPPDVKEEGENKIEV